MKMSNVVRMCPSEHPRDGANRCRRGRRRPKTGWEASAARSSASPTPSRWSRAAVKRQPGAFVAVVDLESEGGAVGQRPGVDPVRAGLAQQTRARHASDADRPCRCPRRGSGCSRIASATARSGVPGSAVARRANARARLISDTGTIGSPQPSMPSSASSMSPVRSAMVCDDGSPGAGGSGRDTYSVRPVVGRARGEHRGVLAGAVHVRRRGVPGPPRAPRPGPVRCPADPRGTADPARRSRARSSSCSTSSTCSGSPSCDAVRWPARPDCAARNPPRSIATACSGLFDERGIDRGVDLAEGDHHLARPASRTISDPRWTHSRNPDRTTSTSSTLTTAPALPAGSEPADAAFPPLSARDRLVRRAVAAAGRRRRPANTSRTVTP